MIKCRDAIASKNYVVKFGPRRETMKEIIEVDIDPKKENIEADTDPMKEVL